MSALCFRLYLSGVPIAKARARFNLKTGRSYTPQHVVSYEGRLSNLAQDIMAGKPPIDGPLCVYVEARVTIPASWSKKKHATAACGALLPVSRPDVDNFAKIIDAFQQIVWHDDRQIVDLRVRKLYDEAPALLVEVFHVSNLFA